MPFSNETKHSLIGTALSQLPLYLCTKTSCVFSKIILLELAMCFRTNSKYYLQVISANTLLTLDFNYIQNMAILINESCSRQFQENNALKPAVFLDFTPYDTAYAYRNVGETLYLRLQNRMLLRLMYSGTRNCTL